MIVKAKKFCPDVEPISSLKQANSDYQNNLAFHIDFNNYAPQNGDEIKA